MDFYFSDEEEFQCQPLPTSAQPRSPGLLFQSLSGASSPESQSQEPEPPTTCSSPRELSEDIPTTPGANGEELGPTISGTIQAKCVLLTWSQVHQGFSKQVIAEHLATLGEISGLAIGQESHADGGTHFHACVIYLKKISRRPTAFALLGKTADVRVANAKRGPLAQCMMNYWTYAQKEDPNPLIVGTPPEGPKKGKTEIYREAQTLAETTSVQAALDHLAAHAPVDYLQRLDTLSRSLTSHRDKRMRLATPGRTLNEFKAHLDIPDDWRNLFLWGKTGVGKTQYAKALLPGATIVSHTDQLKDCDFSKGIIFDDFSVSPWPPHAVIHLMDWDEPRGIHCRYSHVVIPPHTRKIFTFNKLLDAWCPPTISEEQFQAVRRRVLVFEINESLF